MINSKDCNVTLITADEIQCTTFKQDTAGNSTLDISLGSKTAQAAITVEAAVSTITDSNITSWTPL